MGTVAYDAAWCLIGTFFAVYCESPRWARAINATAAVGWLLFFIYDLRSV